MLNNVLLEKKMFCTINNIFSLEVLQRHEEIPSGLILTEGEIPINTF